MISRNIYNYGTANTSVDKSKDEINNIVKALTNTIKVDSIYLFGSYAYGTPTSSSDYDFYVVLPDNHDSDMGSIAVKLNSVATKSCTKPVDLLVNVSSKFNARSSLPTLERVVFKEGIKLYG